MILSSGSDPSAVAPLATALAVPSVLAFACYVAAAIPGERFSSALRTALLVGWIMHGIALVIDVTGIGTDRPGARFGFAPALSVTLWFVLAVYELESRFVPLAGARRALATLGAIVVVVAWLFPGQVHPLAASVWAPLHWLLGVVSYGLFGVAVLHAALMNRAETRLRLKQATPGGMPLLQLERLTFQFVAAGVGVLSLAILLGWWFTPHWKWDHKNLLAVLGWLVLTGLLVGRRVYGWRGRRATRWLYAGAALLLLSYAGSRFVLEVILQRGGA